MQGMSCTYRFLPSSLADLPEQRQYDILIRQQPERAKMSVPNERDRRPIDPPPILQMQWLSCSEDDIKKCLQSPFYFLVANIVKDTDPSQLLLPVQDYLSGSTVSSLYRLRDLDNTDGGFFVFGDLAVKREGKYKLHFSLFEMVEGNIQNRMTLLSDTFTTYLPKHFPGPLEATFLSRTFCDQGVKIRIRKEHRLVSGTGRKRRPDPVNVDHGTGVTIEPPKDPTANRRRRLKQVASLDDSSSNNHVHRARWHSSPSLQQHHQASESSKECYSGYNHHAPAPIPSPPPSITGQISMVSEFGNPYYHHQHQQQQGITVSSFTETPATMPITPPPVLEDMDRHRCNSNSDRLPSLRAIMADTLPSTSRHLPAPIPSSFLFVGGEGAGRVPIHHPISSSPSLYHHHSHYPSF